MAASARIGIREIDGVKVIKFFDRQIFDERIVREVADQIAAALPNDGSPIRAILDFAEVTLISSTFLGKLILMQRRVDATRGQLRLCELSAGVQSVFRTSNLDRLFKIERDQLAALETMR